MWGSARRSPVQLTVLYWFGSVSIRVTCPALAHLAVQGHWCYTKASPCWQTLVFKATAVLHRGWVGWNHPPVDTPWCSRPLWCGELSEHKGGLVITKGLLNTNGAWWTQRGLVNTNGAWWTFCRGVSCEALLCSWQRVSAAADPFLPYLPSASWSGTVLSCPHMGHSLATPLPLPPATSHLFCPSNKLWRNCRSDIQT